MSVDTLEEITTRRRGLVGAVTRLSERFGSVSRRGFFVSAAVAGSALATDPKAYALRPQSAYATICGPGNTASSGWTVFCSTINKGVNACPPGSFAAGWWKAADSSWCGGGYRYIVDCNASCSRCSSGCSGDHICDKGCWSCSCGTGSTATCDQRRICCNAFRYGQCNTHVRCSGGVHCRVVSCVPPYKWGNCTTASLQDNRTSEHSAPSLPQWGPIAAKYTALGDLGSFLKASTGPERAVGDGRGRYVAYQGGIIYWTSRTGAKAMSSFVRSQYGLVGGGPGGPLGYPTSDAVKGLADGGWMQFFEGGVIVDSASTSTQAVWGASYTVWRASNREKGVLGYPTSAIVFGRPDGGWIQLFQKGAIVDSASTATQVVWGASWTVWKANGRETGVLGYPTSAITFGRPDGGWIQLFQKGAIVDSASTATQVVWGASWTVWKANGRETGVLGYPTSAITFGRPDGGWIQLFQKGAIVDSSSTATQTVVGRMFDAWSAAKRESGILGYPTAALADDGKGESQVFQKGELWALGPGPARRVYGAVLDEWKAEGGAGGRYGYPLTDTVETPGGRLTCEFEGGTITA